MYHGEGEYKMEMKMEMMLKGNKLRINHKTQQW